MLCRIGGEEFIIAMPGMNLGAAQRIAERARMAIESDAFEIGGGKAPICVTASIGIAERRDSEGAQEIYKRADEALYRAKSEGRNRVSAAA